MTHSPTEIRALLDRHGLSARRALGQNFAADPNTVRRIAQLSGVGPGDPVVEIGPGLGSLTLALLECGASVLAVEMDRDLLPVLAEVVEGRDVRLVEGDARRIDWAALLAGRADWKLVANLPYNVAAPLVLDLLRDVPAITEMLVMVQREVGERLAAIAPDPAIGVPSVLVACHGTASIVGQVSPNVFIPRPRVDSALVRIVRHDQPVLHAPLATVEQLVRAGYGQRRKMIRKSLAGHLSVDQMVAADVDPQARPETLDVASWDRLAQVAATGRLV